MAEAIIAGLKKILNPEILVADVDPSRLELMRETYGCRTTQDGGEIAASCQVVVLAVKPQIMGEVLEELRGQLKSRHLVISIAAGISLADLREMAGSPRLIRVMPNTPGLIGQGASCLWGDGLLDGDRETADSIFGSIGNVYWLEERYFDAVTGVSGSGPAYVYHFLEAMIDAGVNEGLPRPVARHLAVDTVVGAALMVRETGMHPGELKDMVTSPGGTTIRAMEALEENGLKNAVYKAVGAAARRSRELGGK